MTRIGKYRLSNHSEGDVQREDSDHLFMSPKDLYN